LPAATLAGLKEHFMSNTTQLSAKTIARFFVREQRRYPKLLAGMVGFHPLSILFLGFLPPLIISDILNKLSDKRFIEGDLWHSFGPELLAAIALEAVGGILFWRITIYFNWKLEGLITRDINRKVFDHLLRMSADFHSNRFGGALVSQTTKLANAYVRFTDTSIFQTLGLFWALVFTSVLLVRSAPLFVTLLVAFTVLYVICAFAITRKLRTLSAAEAEAENEQTGYLADSVTNVMAIKSFASSKQEISRFARATEKTRQATLRIMWATLKREAVFATVGTFTNAMAIVLASASVVMFHHSIATTFLVLNYTTNILIRLWEFSTQALRDYNRAFGDAQSMIEILAIQPEIEDPKKPEPVRIQRGAIEFNSVTFTHDGAREDDSLFENLNLHVAAGEKIGLVGHSGSGKTTLTRLLLRFNDIDGGEITIDGQNIARITQDSLRAHIAYVPQEPLLFHRTLRENIAYGKPDASDAEIEAAAEKAHAEGFIRKLSKGYETLVGERGVKLSGGQRQRIVIARAILKDAPILVLDEATSALDSESEKLIQAALLELMQNRTTIVIAHRLSTIQKMDRIIVLDEGRVTEQGTHQELLERGGTYAKLWAHQSGGFLAA
jgi:ATP-binding cassette, subfamily B, bacterial